jgi:hypothetical protein
MTLVDVRTMTVQELLDVLTNLKTAFTRRKSNNLVWRSGMSQAGWRLPAG